MSTRKVRQVSALERRRTKVRKALVEQGKNRLVVSKSAKHIRAQVICALSGKVLAAASSLDKDLREEKVEQGKRKTVLAQKVGEKVAAAAVKANVKNIAFDRSGFRFHGRVKALAEAARTAGLEF